MCLGDLPDGAYKRAFGHSRPKRTTSRLVFGKPRGYRHKRQLRSIEAGVPPYQARQYTRDFCELHPGINVKWDEHTGEALPKTRNDRIKLMKALNDDRGLGLHDPDEVRG